MHTNTFASVKNRRERAARQPQADGDGAADDNDSDDSPSNSDDDVEGQATATANADTSTASQGVYACSVYAYACRWSGAIDFVGNVEHFAYAHQSSSTNAGGGTHSGCTGRDEQ
jgi:hypothetical protein